MRLTEQDSHTWEERPMGSREHLGDMTRRTFCVSFGAGMTMLALPAVSRAALKKVPTSTGIDAVFAPFVVAAERKIFEKHGLETSYKPFDDGNIKQKDIKTKNKKKKKNKKNKGKERKN